MLASCLALKGVTLKQDRLGAPLEHGGSDAKPIQTGVTKSRRATEWRVGSQQAEQER